MGNLIKQIGFVGMGNMAQALANGFIRSGKAEASDMYAFAPNQEKLQGNAQRIGFNPCASAKEAIEAADLVILACKPYQIEDVVKENQATLAGKLIVSVAYGWTFEKAEPILPNGAHYQYMVPNTPVSVCSGTLLVEEKNGFTAEEDKEIENLFSGAGTYMKLPTHLMGAANALAGCGPAFLAMVIEALGDAGVKNGLTRAQAYSLAERTMEGTAKLAAETGLHPGQLKDQVCSPGGVTIRGVAALEEAGMRNAFIKAVDATFLK